MSTALLIALTAGALAAPPDRARLTATPADEFWGARGPGGRSDLRALYDNIDANNDPFVYFGTGVHGSLDYVYCWREDPATGDQADLPSRVSAVEFWVEAQGDGTGVDPGFTVTMDFYEELADWAPVPEPVARGWLGGFFVDVPVCHECSGGYVVELGAASFAIERGRCVVDMRCWEYNGGQPPVTTSLHVYPLFRGTESPVGTSYPRVGLSEDNIYVDSNADGVYMRNERYFFGGSPTISNLMIALYTHDPCFLDFNGDGYVNGDDVDRFLVMLDDGCGP